jgi:hypothetical protein
MSGQVIRRGFQKTLLAVLSKCLTGTVGIYSNAIGRGRSVFTVLNMPRSMMTQTRDGTRMSSWGDPGFVPVRCRSHIKLTCPTCGKEGVHSHLVVPHKGLFPTQEGLYCRRCRTRIIGGKVFTAL